MKQTKNDLNNPALPPEKQRSDSPQQAALESPQKPASESAQQPPPEPFKRTKSQRPPDSWLANDPYTWRGRKIRQRTSTSLYLVRQVFVNGRVELERGWTLYSTDVETIRANYDAYI